MKFEEVLPALRQGKTIRRQSWAEDGDYLHQVGSHLHYHHADVGHDRKIESLDVCVLLAGDWQIGDESDLDVLDATLGDLREYVDMERTDMLERRVKELEARAVTLMQDAMGNTFLKPFRCGRD